MEVSLRIFSRLLLYLGIWIVFVGCDDADYVLDKAIPRLQTPVEKIAWFRTKWRNGEHIETIYFDRQNRILESFNFGLSSWKTLNFYEDDLLVKSIRYAHGDSDEPGNAAVDTVIFGYDGQKRVVMESHSPGRVSTSEPPSWLGPYKLYWDYTATGDTVLKKWEGKYEPLPANITNVNRWERDEKRRVVSHYKLYVLPQQVSDTIEHFTRRYAYDSLGRLQMTWFDSMYLGRFYIAPGPDTISYKYDSKNRLIEELHRNSADMRNKREVDTTQLSQDDRESIRFYRTSFLKGRAHSQKTGRVIQIEYRYETFDPIRHRELEIP